MSIEMTRYCQHCGQEVPVVADAPPPWYEKVMLGHGYEEVGTGGGCTGWEKEFTHRNPTIPTDTILITNGNQSHEMDPLIEAHDDVCWYAGVSEEARCGCHINCVATYGDEGSRYDARVDRIQFRCDEIDGTLTFIDCSDLSMGQVLSRFLEFVENMILIYRNRETGEDA